MVPTKATTKAKGSPNKGAKPPVKKPGLRGMAEPDADNMGPGGQGGSPGMEQIIPLLIQEMAKAGLPPEVIKQKIMDLISAPAGSGPPGGGMPPGMGGGMPPQGPPPGMGGGMPPGMPPQM